MRMFVIRISRFITYFVIIAFTIGHLIEILIIDERIVKGNRYSFQGDWHDFANHNSEVVFIGNSRTWVHINPFKFSKKTNLSSEIIGQDGQRAQILFLKFKEYLKNNKTPKAIVIQFDPIFYDEVDELIGFDDYSIYFYQHRLECTRYFNNKIGYNILYHYIPLLAILKVKKGRKLLRNILINSQIDSDLTWNCTKGFISQNNIAPEFTKINKFWDLQKLNKSPYLDSFFDIAFKKNMKIIGLFSPITNDFHKKIRNTYLLNEKFFDLKKKYGTTGNFFDYGEIPLSSNKSFFYNHQHLNSYGSDSFMNVLLNDSNFIKEFKQLP